MPELEYSTDAVDWIESADETQREQVRSRLEEVRDSEFYEHYLKPLSGVPYHRIRAGDYRIIVQKEPSTDGDDVLFVREIGHRRNVYD